MQELAELLQNVPGIKSIDLKDVRKLAQLLRESPEIGSIEVKGWFGTGIVITRTSNSAHAAPPVHPTGGAPGGPGLEAHPAGGPEWLIRPARPPPRRSTSSRPSRR